MRVVALGLLLLLAALLQSSLASTKCRNDADCEYTWPCYKTHCSNTKIYGATNGRCRCWPNFRCNVEVDLTGQGRMVWQPCWDVQTTYCWPTVVVPAHKAIWGG